MIPIILQSSSAEAFFYGLSSMCCLAIIIAIAFIIFICVILWRASGSKKVEYHTTTIDKSVKGDRRCPKCGRIIPFDAMTCPYCNKKIDKIKSGKSDKEIYCDACKRTIPDDAISCPYCGEKFDNAEAKICRSCGVENTADGKFCKECGKKL